jgi:YesN/AraC family two-component response regulator
MKKLRILIADDHELVRRGALTILQAQNGWRVVGEATNGREAAEKRAKVKPDIVIVDVSMSELDGIEVVPTGNSVRAPLKRQRPYNNVTCLVFVRCSPRDVDLDVADS